MSKEISIIVTGKGAFPMEGIPPLGQHKRIPVELFSATWMKPADEAAEKAIEAHAKKQETASATGKQSS